MVRLTALEMEVALWAIEGMGEEPDFDYTAADIPTVEGEELSVQHSGAREDFLYRLETQIFQMKNSCDTPEELREWNRFRHAAERVAAKVRGQS